MAVFIATFGKLITIFIYILAGFVVARKKIFSEIFTNGISSFLMTVSVPCLIITSFQVEYTPERLRLGGIAFLASVIIIAVGIGIGYLNAYLLRVPVSASPAQNQRLRCSASAYPLPGCLGASRRRC